MRGRALLLLALIVGAATAFCQEAPVTRIAFGSCNREYRPQLLWKPILACQPEVWIWLGDIVYGREDDLPDLARRYQAAKAQPDYQALRRQARVIGMWDDNDFGVSNGGAENPNKRQSQELLLNFLDEPSDSLRRTQAGVYAAYTFGPPGRQVKVILLDGRYFREEPGPSTDVLGAQQWEWLEQELATSTADINLIGSGTQVIATEQSYEKWAEFPDRKSVV